MARRALGGGDASEQGTPPVAHCVDPQPVASVSEPATTLFKLFKQSSPRDSQFLRGVRKSLCRAVVMDVVY